MNVGAAVQLEESSQCSQTTTTDSSMVNLHTRVCKEQARPIQFARVYNLYVAYADLEAEALQITKHLEVCSNINGTIKSILYCIFVLVPNGDV